ncbi:MAG: hypothetical protein M1823_001632 [Watsoniomyces obsoletus]|nr:MAG: hypothetical protein M1823_001632 [Watsoniomyces obsoletus]
MSGVSPKRPARRAATRRRMVVDSSDEEVVDAGSPPEDDSEEFTPAPQRSPRRQSRRKTTASISQTPRTATRRSRPKTGDAMEVSMLELQAEEPSQLRSPTRSPTRRTSPRKRTTMSMGMQSQPNISIPPPVMATLRPSPSPEPSKVQSTPLGDITDMATNIQLPAMQKVEGNTVRPMPPPPIMEKPMDIVIRSRAMPQTAPMEPKAPGPRIVLTYLILTNFKSYAGRQEVGPFHSSFSSVVGPNGSGKSNVIDSLLFVFGFRASKMRQGKISALIHKSAAFPDLDHCEVQVHFHEVLDTPGGKTEAVPDSTLLISRKAFKNNSSKYYINGKETNFTTVTTLLRARGVDLDHKRFLILQGEVESIAQMKPKAANEHDDGLLEYLEDIIGTSQYKVPIEETTAEAEMLNDVCVEKNSRVQHVEKEKNSLEDKKNKAIAFVKNENELALKQSALYQVYIDECNDNINVTQQAVNQMQAQLESELGKHKGNEDEIKALNKTYQKNTKECEALEKNAEKLSKEMAKFDKENVKFDEKKKFLSGKQKKLEKTMQTSRFAASESENLVQRSVETMERNSAQIEYLETSVKEEEHELAKIREALTGKTQVFSDQIAVKQKALEPWSEKINERQSSKAVAQSELDILQERRNASAVAAQEVQERIKSIEESRQSKLAELEDVKIQRSKLDKDASKMRAEVEKLARKEPEVRAQVSAARQKAEEARSSLSATQTQGNVLSGLKRLNDSGRIQGFHGRLGNLGTIDQKYDVAISTACPALDNIVVDTVEVGQQCINYLRQNNLGRAMFILLDRLAQKDLSPIDTPEGVPRLFDLVTAKDDKFRAAFYSVLQNTLVAEDLQQANRIAYGAKRWRVVTLDGQLIDKSGTMSGGGTKVAKGGMSSKLVADVSKEQVSKLEAECESMEEQFQAFKQRQRELEGQLLETQTAIPRLDTQIQKGDLEIESYGRNLADAQKRLTELSAAEHHPSQSDDKQIAALQKQIAVLEKQIADIHQRTSSLEDEIKALQDKIMEVGGVKLRGQKAKVDGLREQIKTLSDEMSMAEVSKAKAEKQKAKHEKSMSEAEAEIESVIEEMTALEETAKKQEEVAHRAKKDAEEAQDALQSKKEDLAALKADLDEKTTQLNVIRGAEIEMRSKLEENQKVVAENQKRCRYWQEKLNKLSIQSLSDLGEGDATTGSDELPTYTKDELMDLDKETLKSEIAVLEEKTSNANVELGVLSEYRRRVEEHSARTSDLESAVQARDAVKRRCDDLRRKRLEGFMEGFGIISLRLKEMYQMITMGGNAELELVDSLDPFSEGILFSVMPPKKSWKNISNLSGGEKTLSSLALVFALHHYKPTPLYVMDEIDAALDFRNVSIVASYIKERTKNAQFIVISLRNNMFELASRLVGVYKVNHMTKSVTIENRDYLSAHA